MGQNDKWIVRASLSVDLLEPTPDNPNVMSSRAFDQLVNNMQETGFTDPAYVVPLSTDEFWQAHKAAKDGQESVGKVCHQLGVKFQIRGGHHRIEAAKYLGYTEVPCTIFGKPGLDQEFLDAQMLRQNMIRGKLDVGKFMTLYDRHVKNLGKEAMADLFGFADEDELAKIVASVKASLPDELKKKFTEAAAELKTVDDLSKLLNRLFTTYGDTLNHGYMFLDYGGKDSVWVRVNAKTLKAVRLLGDVCVNRNRTMDDLLGGVIQEMAKGSLNEFVEKIILGTPEVKGKTVAGALPTYDNMELTDSVKES
jgi:hypothetical protein